MFRTERPSDSHSVPNDILGSSGANLSTYRCDLSDEVADTVHGASCSIWDVPPQSQPDALLSAAVRTEEAAAYLAEVRPLYDAVKRCIGQLSGVLLLLQTNCLDRNRDGLLIASVSDQLHQAHDRLRAMCVPSVANRHHAILSELLTLLDRILTRLDRLRDLIDPASPDLGAVVGALFSAQHALMAASLPAAGLSPVDFTAACCNCRTTKN